MSGKVYLIGTGPGDSELLTGRAVRLIKECESAFALGQRLAEQAKPFRADVETVALGGIEKAIPEGGSAAVLLSGDAGFFSAAKLLGQKLRGRFEVETVSGISSLQYLCAKAGVGWENLKVVSLHGRDGQCVGPVAYNPAVFFLTGGRVKAQDVCKRLSWSGLGSAAVTAGERLSLPGERIVTGTAGELCSKDFCDLTSLLVENPGFADRHRHLSDRDFVRGGVPMTKEEVRWLCAEKLCVSPSDTVWDIGAGTGSVSVELARRAHEGAVLAIEKEEEALGLIEENRLRLGAFNVTSVRGEAPGCFENLPRPDKAFVGGSGGNLSEILRRLADINPGIGVVVTAVTLETLSEATGEMERLGMEPDVVSVGIARARKVGSRHLMTAQNPVFIISGKRGSRP